MGRHSAKPKPEPYPSLAEMPPGYIQAASAMPQGDRAEWLAWRTRDPMMGLDATVLSPAQLEAAWGGGPEQRRATPRPRRSPEGDSPGE